MLTAMKLKKDAVDFSAAVQLQSLEIRLTRALHPTDDLLRYLLHDETIDVRKTSEGPAACLAKAS